MTLDQEVDNKNNRQIGEGGQTLSALGVTGEPEGGLLPWVSVPEFRLSGGFRVEFDLPKVGQPASLARAQTGHSEYVVKEPNRLLMDVI